MKARARAPVDVVEDILEGAARIQAIYVATRLGIPDLLRDSARSSTLLASAAGVHPEALHRLLRFLAVEGIFALTEDERFAGTPVSKALTLGDPSGLRAEVLAMATRGWEAWRDLLHAVETGQPATGAGLGGDVLAPGEGREAEQAAAAGKALAAATDLRTAPCVVDLQCGDGAFLAEVLKHNPAARGVALDCPETIERARLLFEAAHLDHRVDLLAGDLLAEAPGGGNYYLLRRVLHGRDDAHALLILANCQAAMPTGARLAIVESLLGNDPAQTPAAVREDLAGLVLTGGRERTLFEYRALAEHAGLRFDRAVALRGTKGLTAIEFSRGLL